MFERVLTTFERRLNDWVFILLVLFGVGFESDDRAGGGGIEEFERF